MNEHSLRNLLTVQSEQSIGSIQIFEDIDSTNAESLRQIQAGNTENRVILASSQSAGRGRRGRHWMSPKDAGIYLSVVRDYSQEANTLQGLSLVTAISVLDALEDLGARKLALKWPNDVLFEKKKLAGILLEMQQQDATRFIVFGIGVNIKLPADTISTIDRPVTDLHKIVGQTPPQEELIAELLNHLCRNLAIYESQGFSYFEERWNYLDCYIGSEIEIQNGSSRITGESLGVNSDGSLQLRTEKGIQSIVGGEVFPSLRPVS